MSPVSAFLLLIVFIFSGVSVVLKLPIWLLSLLLGPFLGHFHYVIEFLYPTGIGRWIHLTLVRLVMHSKRPSEVNRNFHSRTIEMRVEIIPERVYLHPLPQFLDNLGYLVVCCPVVQEDIDSSAETPVVGTGANLPKELPIVAFVVDCGEAESVAEQVELISDLFYQNKPIQIQSILSTHKHHDHTAGNRGLVNHPDVGRSIKLVFGGVVENVPGCNFPLPDGELVPLPKSGDNDMNNLIEIEAVATPAHTRGSLAYVMRPKNAYFSSASSFIFTGDTMFSAGSGVPFEADLSNLREEQLDFMTPTSTIPATLSLYAVERCFAEILARCVRFENILRTSSDQILIFPGHEYTAELLNRQLSQAVGESCKWKNFSPAYFFETVSQYYVSIHRRSLPHTSGKLLNAPTSLRRELLINPQLRMLYKRGEVVIRAVQLWHKLFARVKIPAVNDLLPPKMDSSFAKGLSTEKRWNLDAKDIDRTVFTTVYTADLQSVMRELEAGNMEGPDAAARLREITMVLRTPTIGRRPIPDTLPTDRTVVRALVGFVLLGSRPCGLSLSDSKRMNLPPPIVASSDAIRISKSRLISLLYWLGLLTEETQAPRLIAMIDRLWKETLEYSKNRAEFRYDTSTNLENGDIARNEAVEVEVELSKATADMEDDEVELGALRWMVYGIPQKPPSRFAQFCMPCDSTEAQPYPAHPVDTSGLRKHAGELVRHDIHSCLLCQSIAGCPFSDEDLEPAQSDRATWHKRAGSTLTNNSEAGFEMTTEVLNALLRETMMIDR